MLAMFSTLALLWRGKGPWWFGSGVGSITRVSLSGCQMDKTSRMGCLCHQERGLQVWAEVVPSLLSSPFFPLSLFPLCQFSWFRVGRNPGLGN